MFRYNGHAKKDVEGARALGWASIAIGLTELLAPKQVENLLGIDHSTEQQGILRVLGVREIGHGVSILAEDRPTTELATSLWSRVAGDVLDTVLLARAGTKTRKPLQFAMVAASVMAIGVADMLYAQRLSRPTRYESAPKKGMKWAGRLAHVYEDD